ncbi:molybdate ABC transporter substrate-binding protein [Myceligenerans pegani]|uniref:Molybdate ABC transporter substrate-binding protein n=1 Tax=Myceligenerans pegani TaxID=2776917 RepID=A0ABR9N321_9MICO|nr:molybdate ABC transporter substrate-binding protein [Myceligenerans sp. TRM 65318]MBE1877676.1 molybdate ABC transporter substrate-binding protein [Myceligenerans sp. TRM 65318]MBE3019947.1 molybdate ABC transporter substrate-binding protein [Myceligenerans sp. TRM 65318]
MTGARRRTQRLVAATILVPAAAVVLAGCGAVGGGARDDTLQVLAAASLTDAFTELGERFEAEHDGVEVQFSFGSSTDLAEQAADGAPGDVLATADEAAMEIAGAAGAVVDPVVFATNTLVIVTPPGNPAAVRSLGDLAGATWVRCADEVPCGRAARALLDDAGVGARPASLEEDARATLDKVVSGEAEAALVYATDAASAGDAVTAVEVPGADGERNAYLMAPLAQAGDAELAVEWADFVTGPEGGSVLTAAGFSRP